MAAVTFQIGGHSFRDICSALLGEDLTRDVESPLLQQLSYYGALYNRIRTFIEAHHPTDVSRKSYSHPLAPSVYVESLCDGLSHLLDEYVTRVLKLTAQQDNHMHPNQHSFMHNLNSELSVLKGLSALVDQLAQVNPQSAQVFALVLRHANTGFSEVRQAISRILLYSLHNCLVSQVSSWCLLSRLDKDPYAEFFIRRVDSGRKHPFAVVSERNGNVPMMYEEWNSLYDVDDKACPCYVSGSVAREVLFMGKAMEVMGREARLEGVDIGLVGELKEILGGLKICGDFNQDHPEFVEVEEHFNRFELVVNQSHEIVSTQMWNFVESSSSMHGNLLEILHAFRGFFLLGQGEMFSGFFEQFMKEYPRLKSPLFFKKSLQDAFEQVKQDSFPSDSFHQRFSLSLKQVDMNGVESASSDLLVLGNVYGCEALGEYEFTRECSNGLTKPGIVGSLWKMNPINVNQRFSTRFTLNMRDSLSRTSADSSESPSTFSFVVQNQTLDISSLSIDSKAEVCSLGFDKEAGFALQIQQCAPPWANEGAESDDESEEHWCKMTILMLGEDVENSHHVPERCATFRTNDDEGLSFLLDFDQVSHTLSVQANGSRSEELLAQVSADVTSFTSRAAYAWFGFMGVSPGLEVSFSISDWRIKESELDSCQNSSTSDMMHTIWKQMYLTFEFRHISESLFFGAEDLAIYNRVFQQLSMVKFVHFQLREAWLRFKSKDFIRNTENYRLYHVVRYKMFFFVDHLMSYLQVEVLEKKFSEMCAQICERKNFGVARQIHKEFLNDVAWKCFSHGNRFRAVGGHITSLLDLSLTFCNPRCNDDGMIRQLLAQFDKRVSFLIGLLSQGQPRVSSHLEQIIRYYGENSRY